MNEKLTQKLIGCPIGIRGGGNMKRKKVKITGELDGEKVFEVDMSAANDDWMRAGRLKARADAGDKEAAAELKRMEVTPMVEITDDEDPD